ncbi:MULTISPECIES: solute carrier family 23 protein [unclassified Cobetia]|uniref:solute carrier family 23 protein n=1 Tax=unclassified Cobetia TaxID=2609414 RepID=UPI00178C90A3|nr:MULTISPECIES: solute carrier family 23 protein [unclassified Cobetia]MBE2167755.1 xanthine/uracil/vitamin C permease [Cobetia sp. 2AS1]MDH2446177.1 solute carrier family 23 protein [Cobetia sp. 2AS]
MRSEKIKEGKEQPFIPAGPFKLRIPFVHYRFEMAECVQAITLSVVTISMIPLLQQYLGIPYDVAVAFIIVCGIGNMIPSLLGTPLVPGWITPAIPLVVLFLGDYEPGPEAIQALVAVQLLVFFIFALFGLTGLGGKIVNIVPNSLKSGIVMGAGIAALLGEIEEGGRLLQTPISITVGALLTAYLMFSISFKNLRKRNAIVKFISNYGMVPAILIAILVGLLSSEYSIPVIEWGIVSPAFGEMWSYLPFTIGFPSLNTYFLAVPTAVIAYIIAYGDIIVGDTLVDKMNSLRNDEFIDNNPDRVHLVTAIRNILHALFAPYVGLAGPVWTAVTATVLERYTFGKKAMESVFSGSGTFMLVNFISLFLLPLMTFFQPVLPIALSLTMLVTGFLCIQVGMEQAKTSTEKGVAGIVAVVLAVYGAAYGIIIGITLYFIVQKEYKPNNSRN